MRMVNLMVLLAIAVTISCSGGEETKVEPVDVFLVAIDAAHGGDAFGAVSESGISEKDVVLSMAQYIDENCSIDGVEVGLVRKIDENISLTNRLEQISDMDADIVISIHIGASKDPSKSGTTIYHRENDDSSKELCELLKSNLLNIEDLKSVECDAAKFVMLKDSQVPTISIQLGHITNTLDYQFITTDKGKEAFGAAIVSTIDEYYSMQAKRN
jgi:N-acetylmuramoyl-L-alanine amidase